MRHYTRREIVELLQIEDDFIIALESEEIIVRDAPHGEAIDYSERMLERVRVASNLVDELDVNLPGVAVILQMREQLSEQRRRIERFMLELREGQR